MSQYSKYIKSNSDKGRSSRKAQNITITLPPNLFGAGAKAEIFWQTAVCDKFVKEYQADVLKRGKAKLHDLLFNEVEHVLIGNVIFEQVKKTNKFAVYGRFRNKIYVSYISLVRRRDCGDTIFAVVNSCYLCNDPEKIRNYEGSFKIK